MATVIDFIRTSKPARSGTHYASIAIDERQPIPSVGDTVVVTKGKRTSVLRVERRNFHYLETGLYLQLFFSKAE